MDVRRASDGMTAMKLGRVHLLQKPERDDCGRVCWRGGYSTAACDADTWLSPPLALHRAAQWLAARGDAGGGVWARRQDQAAGGSALLRARRRYSQHEAMRCTGRARR